MLLSFPLDLCGVFRLHLLPADDMTRPAIVDRHFARCHGLGNGHGPDPSWPWPVYMGHWLEAVGHGKWATGNGP